MTKQNHKQRSLTALAPLLLALAAAPLPSFAAFEHLGGHTGLAATTPLLAVFQTRTLAPTPADGGGVRPPYIRAALGRGGGDVAERGGRLAAAIGGIASSHLPAWGKLQLDGG